MLAPYAPQLVFGLLYVAYEVYAEYKLSRGASESDERGLRGHREGDQ